MNAIIGNVTINDAPTKQKLHRFVEKKISQWVADKEGYLPTDIRFSVAFVEEQNRNQISCVTEVRVSGCLWRGWDLAHDTQSAFVQSLKRLHPN